jgi:hypothetical protein
LPQDMKGGFVGYEDRGAKPARFLFKIVVVISAARVVDRVCRRMAKQHMAMTNAGWSSSRESQKGILRCACLRAKCSVGPMVSITFPANGDTGCLRPGSSQIALRYAAQRGWSIWPFIINGGYDAVQFSSDERRSHQRGSCRQASLHRPMTGRHGSSETPAKQSWGKRRLASSAWTEQARC